LPRPRRPDADDVEGRADDHGMVPELPPQPRAPPAGAARHLQHGIRRHGAPAARARARAGEAQSHTRGSDDQLLGVPSMSRRPDADQITAGAPAGRMMLPVLSDGPVLWRSLEELAAG